MFGHWTTIYPSDRLHELDDDKLDDFIRHAKIQRSWQATPTGFSYWDQRVGKARREEAKRTGEPYIQDQASLPEFLRARRDGRYIF